MMLVFSLLASLAQANMGPPPGLEPPCSVDSACPVEPGTACAHPPQQQPPCPALEESGLRLACTVALPDLEGRYTSVYCAETTTTEAAPPAASTPTPSSMRRCGAASAAAVVPLLLLGLWRREDVRQL